MIIGNHTEVRTPLPTIKFLFSQNLLSGKLAQSLKKIQEHDLSLTTTNTIKGRDLSLHLAHDLNHIKEVESQNECFAELFLFMVKNLKFFQHPWYHDVICI